MKTYAKQSLGRDAVEMVARLFRRDDDPPAPPVPIDVKRLRARLKVAQEMAIPGFMSLRPVRDGEQIVDFEWDFASVAATRMLVGGLNSLVGKRLVEVLEGRAGRGEVFSQYRRVLEFGSAKPVYQMVEVNNAVDVISHAALRLHDGIAVTLTNMSAVRRERALQLEIQARTLIATSRAT